MDQDGIYLFLLYKVNTSKKKHKTVDTTNKANIKKSESWPIWLSQLEHHSVSREDEWRMRQHLPPASSVMSEEAC